MRSSCAQLPLTTLPPQLPAGFAAVFDPQPNSVRMTLIDMLIAGLSCFSNSHVLSAEELQEFFSLTLNSKSSSSPPGGAQVG